MMFACFVSQSAAYSAEKEIHFATVWERRFSVPSGKNIYNNVETGAGFLQLISVFHSRKPDPG
jgi:hypothetical protein